MCCWKNCRLTLYRRPIKSPVVQRWVVLLMACREGVEPSTSGIEVRCSVQLSYRQKMEHGVRFELTRTCVTGLANRRLRPLGYPCETGAGRRNRTPIPGVEGRCSTIELHPQRRIRFSSHRPLLDLQGASARRPTTPYLNSAQPISAGRSTSTGSPAYRADWPHAASLLMLLRQYQH